jgi:hypothetical protein
VLGVAVAATVAAEASLAAAAAAEGGPGRSLLELELKLFSLIYFALNIHGFFIIIRHLLLKFKV